MAQSPLVRLHLRDNHFGNRQTGGRGELLHEAVHDDICDESRQKIYDLLGNYSGKALHDWKGLGINVYSARAEQLAKEDDEAFDKSAFSIDGADFNSGWINTGNCMGVLRLTDQTVGCSVQVEIGSRFDNGDEQYFLSYLLSKVFGGSIVEDVQIGSNSMWDMLLAFVFRHRLQEACRVGLFRQYRTFSHNDLRFKGKFDLDEHLRRNVPFQGKIAYTTNEITFDNPTNHLIRHAIEKVRRKWGGILAGDRDLTQLCHDFAQNTPTWERARLLACFRDNLQPVKHPYFQPYYEPLRRLALAILHDEGASLYDTANEAEGVLFDGSWLWENYLAEVLRGTGFQHCIKGQTTGLGVFGSYTLYPDFYHKEKCVVLDAKYQRVNESEPKRENVHQLLAYMFLAGASRGGLIYPRETDQATNKKEISIAMRGGPSFWQEGSKAWWHDIVFKTPKPDEYNGDCGRFRDSMQEAETRLLKDVTTLMQMGK